MQEMHDRNQVDCGATVWQHRLLSVRGRAKSCSGKGENSSFKEYFSLLSSWLTQVPTWFPMLVIIVMDRSATKQPLCSMARHPENGFWRTRFADMTFIFVTKILEILGDFNAARARYIFLLTRGDPQSRILASPYHLRFSNGHSLKAVFVLLNFYTLRTKTLAKLAWVLAISRTATAIILVSFRLLVLSLPLSRARNIYGFSELAKCLQ